MNSSGNSQSSKEKNVGAVHKRHPPKIGKMTPSSLLIYYTCSKTHLTENVFLLTLAL